MRVLFHFYGYICFHCYLMRHKHKLTMEEEKRAQQVSTKMSKQMNCGFKSKVSPSLSRTPRVQSFYDPSKAMVYDDEKNKKDIKSRILCVCLRS